MEYFLITSTLMAFIIISTILRILDDIPISHLSYAFTFDKNKNYYIFKKIERIEDYEEMWMWPTYSDQSKNLDLILINFTTGYYIKPVYDYNTPNGSLKVHTPDGTIIGNVKPYTLLYELYIHLSRINSVRMEQYLRARKGAFRI